MNGVWAAYLDLPLTVKVGASVAVGGVTIVAGLDPAAMFAAILAVDLAQFAVVLDHRGRIAGLEVDDQGGGRPPAD